MRGLGQGEGKAGWGAGGGGAEGAMTLRRRGVAGGRPDPSVCRMAVPREVSETSLQLATEVHDSCGQVLKARRCRGRPWYNGQEHLTRRKEHGIRTTKTAKI